MTRRRRHIQLTASAQLSPPPPPRPRPPSPCPPLPSPAPRASVPRFPPLVRPLVTHATRERTKNNRLIFLLERAPPRAPSTSPLREQADDSKTVWRSGQHEFNSDTSDGTWGFSQFVSVGVLNTTPGFLSEDGDEVLTATCNVVVRWKRVGSDGFPAAAFGMMPPAGVTPETGLELPTALRHAYVEEQGTPVTPGQALTGFLQGVGAQGDVAAAAAKAESADFEKRLRVVEREGITPVALAGLWTMPLWRTLQQVHPGGSLHWQTLAIVTGFISDVLMRLCRAAAESYEDHVHLGKPPTGVTRLELAEAAHPDGPPKPPPGGWPVIPGARQAATSAAKNGNGGSGGNNRTGDGGGEGASGGSSSDAGAPASAPSTSSGDTPASSSGHREKEGVAASRGVAGGVEGKEDTPRAGPRAGGETAASEEEEKDEPGGGGEGGRTGGPLSVLHVAAAIAKVLPKELALHASAEARDALEATVGSWRGPGPPPTALVFAPDRVLRAATTLAECGGAGVLAFPEGDVAQPNPRDVTAAMILPHATPAARVYLSAVLEYMCAELLELSVDQAVAATKAASKAAGDGGGGDGRAGGSGSDGGSSATSSPGHSRRSSVVTAMAGGEAGVGDQLDASKSAPPNGAKSHGSRGKDGKEVGSSAFVLPAHLVQALRADDELGARTAAAAMLPYAGVTYASLLALYTPPQPAARKTLQKKKADAALDRQWEKELRRKQREAEKAKKEREEKARKEREKDRRRAEKEAARREKEKEMAQGKTEGGGANTAADNSVTELIALRMRERIIAKEKAAMGESGGDGGGSSNGGGVPIVTGIGGDAGGIAGTGRLLLPCAASSAPQCGGCVEVLPDLGDGFSAVECLVPLSCYVAVACQKGCGVTCHTRCFPRWAASMGLAAPPATASDASDAEATDGGGAGAVLDEPRTHPADAQEITSAWFPLDCTCPVPGCSAKVTVAERWARGAWTDVLTKPKPPSPPPPPPPPAAKKPPPAPPATLTDEELAALAARKAREDAAREIELEAARKAEAEAKAVRLAAAKAKAEAEAEARSRARAEAEAERARAKADAEAALEAARREVEEKAAKEALARHIADGSSPSERASDDDEDDGEEHKKLSKKEKKKAKKERRRLEKRAAKEGGKEDAPSVHAVTQPTSEGPPGAVSSSSFTNDPPDHPSSLPRGPLPETPARPAAYIPLTERLRAARRVHVSGLPRGATAAALKAYLNAALAPSHGPGAVVGAMVQQNRTSERASDEPEASAPNPGGLVAVVELATAAAAAAAHGLDARAPGGGALEIRPSPEAPHLSEPSGEVTAALDAAIAAGALSANDVDDDAWEALHLVDPASAVPTLRQLAAEGAAAGVMGGGGAALIAALQRREAEAAATAATVAVGPRSIDPIREPRADRPPAADRLGGRASRETASAADQPPPPLAPPGPEAQLRRVPLRALCRWVMCNPAVRRKWSAPGGGACLSCGAVIPERHGWLCTYPAAEGDEETTLGALHAAVAHLKVGGPGPSGVATSAAGSLTWTPPPTTARGYPPRADGDGAGGLAGRAQSSSADPHWGTSGGHEGAETGTSWVTASAAGTAPGKPPPLGLKMAFPALGPTHDSGGSGGFGPLGGGGSIGWGSSGSLPVGSQPSPLRSRSFDTSIFDAAPHAEASRPGGGGGFPRPRGAAEGSASAHHGLPRGNGTDHHGLLRGDSVDRGSRPLGADRGDGWAAPRVNSGNLGGWGVSSAGGGGGAARGWGGAGSASDAGSAIGGSRVPPPLPRPLAVPAPRPIPAPMTLTGVKTEEDDDDLCPICAETMDATDKEFFPCPCGFQFCCFCYNRMAEVGDHFRCPACRKPFGDGAEEGRGDGGGGGGSESEDDSEDDAVAAVEAAEATNAWGR